MKLATIILAAGKGKRMNDPEKPKVLFELHGVPMIESVVRLALDSHSEKIILIVGHKREAIIEHVERVFSEDMARIEFVVQESQLGTGHAVAQAEKALDGFQGSVLILSGDVPLLKASTIQSLIAEHNKEQWTASLISGIAGNPFGYGRILRDNDKLMIGIREEKDSSEQEKAIPEINSGIYLVESQKLFEALATIEPNNTQGEYYLTDIFGHFHKTGDTIGAYPTKNMIEITGVNTRDQLDALEQVKP